MGAVPNERTLVTGPLPKRIAMFDIAKAIALIAVIIGHTNGQGLPTLILNFCYSFDMPLFFIISGYFVKDNAVLCKEYVIKNIKNLIFPYLGTWFILILLSIVRTLLYPEGHTVVQTINQWFIAGLYGAGGVFNGMPEGVVSIGAIWYLLALFWAKLFLVLANQTRFTPIVVLGYFVFGFVSAETVWLPLSIQAGFCATLFLYIGQLTRRYNIIRSTAIHPALWLTGLFVWLFCAIYYGKLYMVSNSYNDGIIDIVGAVCGSLCILKISDMLSSNSNFVTSVLQRFGQITLPVFCMHLIELKITPWGLLNPWLFSLPVPSWLVGLAIRVLIIAVLSILLWYAPRRLSGIFYPSRRV